MITVNSGERGFTLLELLTIMAIIGLLSSISLSQYSSYKRRAFDAASESDLREAATAMEIYYLDNNQYADCSGSAACQALLINFSAGSNVNVDMNRIPAAGATPEHFTGLAFHPQGDHSNPANAWRWDSSRGGLQ